MKIRTEQVGGRIHVYGAPIDMRLMVRDALTFEHPEYREAIREARQPPARFIYLWEEEGGVMSVPVGWLRRLYEGAKYLGHEVESPRHAFLAPAFGLAKIQTTLKLRPVQDGMRNAMKSWSSGIIRMPTGSGKTIGALSSLDTTTLVIVDRLELIDQWIDAVHLVYGHYASIGVVGGNVLSDGDIVIALRQAVMGDRMRPEWWNKWTTLIIDECHHVQAPSYQEILDKCGANTRYGLSATPDREDGWWPITKAMLGPIIYDVNSEGLYGDVLMRPRATRVKSNFTYKYRPTRVDKSTGERIQNNYNEMMTALVRDTDRNNLIAEAIADVRGHPTLVLSRRLEHLEVLEQMTKIMRPMALRYFLTRKQTRTDRANIRQMMAANRDMVIFTTIGDEALDLPTAEVLVLAYPTSKLAIVRQQVGRIERSYVGKQHCEVIDICDVRVPILQTRAWQRRSVYIEKKMEVHNT